MIRKSAMREEASRNRDPVGEARKFVLASCRLLTPHRVVLGDASGCVHAEQVTAEVSVPPFANSAMDGYAVRAADTINAPTRLRVVGSLLAGDDNAITVCHGEAVRIMTGAPLPRGVDAVCIVEHTRARAGGTIVVIEEAVDPNTNVRRAGEDIATGAEVFATGTVLAPPHIGVLARLGLDAILVYPRPRVSVVSTGDELASSPGTLGLGKIRDANRPALLTQLRVEGCETIDLGTVGDDKVALSHVFDEGGLISDAVVVSGGVGAGDRDIVRVVLENMSNGAMRWMQVAVKPAKPFAFGMLARTGTPVFGLPGNPVAAVVSYELFVRPALRAMAGHRGLDRPCLSAVAEVDLRRRHDGKLHLLWVLAKTGIDGTLSVRPSGCQDSHMLRAMAGANALALIPDSDGVSAGDSVDVLVLDPNRLDAAKADLW